jgi:symplekin
MERALVDDKRYKAATTVTDSKKRPSPSIDEASEAKRPRLEQDIDPAASASASFLAAFDFTSLPATLITELIVANIEAFTEPSLISLVQLYRQSRGGEPPPPGFATPTATAATQELIAEPTPVQITKLVAPQPVKLESVDPLQMDIDEEIEYEPDRLNLEVCCSVLACWSGAH